MPGKADKTLQNSAIQGILRVTTSLICQYACIIGYLATVATSSDSEIEQENFMIKVLFICHGNICRSPISEFVLKDMVEKLSIADKFEIASASTSTEEIWGGKGNPIYPPAQEVLRTHGIGRTAYTDFSGKRARQITRQDYEYYDYALRRYSKCEEHNAHNRSGLPGQDTFAARLCGKAWTVYS